VSSAWIDAPATRKGGYFTMRNQTAARGTIVWGSIEWRFV
jgi:hypothetical protein